MLRGLKFWIISGLFTPMLGFSQPSELDCLTANVFFEARGESLQGKRAIADVTINRTKHSAFIGQDSVCKVVFAKGQFSWTTQPRKRTQRLLNGDLRSLKDKDILAYHLSRKVAEEALNNEPKSRLPASVISFHSVGILPQWAGKMKFYAKIGNHKFYSFKRKG
jgi:spore germination cell wall hydrolase CwlJ-like protein